MAATLGSLRVDLGLELAKFQSDMGKAQNIVEQGMRKIQKTGERIAQLLEAEVILRGVRALARQVQAAAEQGSQLVDLSQKTGIAIRELSRLSIVAADSGIKFEDFSGNLVKFNKSIADAIGGTKEQAEAFRLLGISQEDLKRLSPDQVLQKVADRFKDFEDGANKARLAQALFGREGANLIPLLNQGGEAIREQAEEAERLGLTLNDAQARGLKAFQDRMDKSGQVTEAFRNNIAIGLVPVLDTLLGQFNDAATNAEAFERAQRTAAAAGRILASAVLIVTNSLSGMGNALGGIAAAAAKLFEGGSITDSGLTIIKRFATNGAAALKILDETRRDTTQGLSDGLTNLNEIWDASAKKAEDTAERIAKAAKKTSAPNLEASLASGREMEEAGKKAEKAREKFDNMRLSLEAQVAAFGKSNTAILEYRLTQGDLADDLALLGEKAAEVRDGILQLSEAFERRQAAAQEMADTDDYLNGALERNIELITGASSATLEYAERMGELEDLLASGQISQDEFNGAVARLKLSFSDLYQEWVDVAQDMEGAFADFLFEPTQDGFNDMVDSFGRSLRRMAAEAAASALFKSIGNWGNANAGEGGWLGALASIASAFGGGKAIGGPVMPNSLYRVNENGPELLNASGRQYLMTGAGGGNVSPMKAANDGPRITVIQNITTPDVASMRASASQIAANAFAQASRAHARNR